MELNFKKSFSLSLSTEISVTHPPPSSVSLSSSLSRSCRPKPTTFSNFRRHHLFLIPQFLSLPRSIVIAASTFATFSTFHCHCLLLPPWFCSLPFSLVYITSFSFLSFVLFLAPSTSLPPYPSSSSSSFSLALLRTRAGERKGERTEENFFCPLSPSTEKYCCQPRSLCSFLHPLPSLHFHFLLLFHATSLQFLTACHATFIFFIVLLHATHTLSSYSVRTEGKLSSMQRKFLPHFFFLFGTNLSLLHPLSPSLLFMRKNPSFL